MTKEDKLDLSQPVPEPECGIRIVVKGPNGLPKFSRAFQRPESYAPINCLLISLMGGSVTPHVRILDWDEHAGVRRLELELE